ncbi:peptidase A22B, signal peptide peptidase [Collybia nuda]|uniref:Peptidase A22B, signal peptide peptidase n=1 Tax=Collybia nuda TaxID=64659 RepID=A0A9P5Y488_9AGAR|nr:peptidase A22B, signal peptide peptidase [Collybia nuda]
MGEIDWDLLSSYAGLITLAGVSVFVGAFGSLPSPKDSNGVSVYGDDEENMDRVSSSDAWLFPLFGSAALLGLYTIVKVFGTDWINWFLGWYFSVAGIGSVWKSSIFLARYILGPRRWTQFSKSNISIRYNYKTVFFLSWRTPSLFLLPIAAIPSALYSFSSFNRKSVLLTDILALSFTHNALSVLKIDSFQTGSILLSGLFFYDIWWVFGTEVMVKVATNLDVPIKLLWPKSVAFASNQGFTMLGLGDVVIPGTFVALALRYDYSRSLRTGSFRKPYFHASLGAYVLGLIAAFSAMYMFEAAQPALLYLSPACILSLFATAVLRKELDTVWSWSDDPTQISTIAINKEK